MIAAGLQLDIAWEDPDENYRRAGALADEAGAAGARLLALPEMFATGFSMAADRVAAHADATRAFLSALAAGRDAWVLGGYAELRDGRTRNVCSLFRPDGAEALHYEKLHPFTHAGEQLHYAAGDALGTADADGVRLTALICYDLRFPEPFRAAARDTDVFVVVANWPIARAAAWRTLLTARAIENQAYVLGVNRVGSGGGLDYRGDTALVDPFGEILASASVQPRAVVGEIDPRRVTAARDRYGFVGDRRPDIYAALEAQRRRARLDRADGSLIEPPDAV